MRLQDREVRKLPLWTQTAWLMMLGLSPVPSRERQQSCMESLWFETIDARFLTVKAAHAKTCKWFL